MSELKVCRYGEGGVGLLWTKSFIISIEVVGGKLRGIIEERGRSLSAWIRFGKLSLRCLLEGVESFCRDEVLVRWCNSWEEGGRKFKLERRSNGTLRFLFCSVITKEGKRFSLIFPEGRSLSAENQEIKQRSGVGDEVER